MRITAVIGLEVRVMNMYKQPGKEVADLAAAKELSWSILLPASRDIVASYQRGVFGDYAVDSEVMAMVDADLRYRVEFSISDSDEFTDALGSIWGMGIQEMLTNPSVARIYGYYDRAVGELHALWKNTPSDFMHGYAFTQHLNSQEQVWADIYVFLHQHPAALPYFQTGLTDIPLIQRALDEDIDPSLLMSVVA